MPYCSGYRKKALVTAMIFIIFNNSNGSEFEISGSLFLRKNVTHEGAVQQCRNDRVVDILTTFRSKGDLNITYNDGVGVVHIINTIENIAAKTIDEFTRDAICHLQHQDLNSLPLLIQYNNFRLLSSVDCKENIIKRNVECGKLLNDPDGVKLKVINIAQPSAISGFEKVIDFEVRNTLEANHSTVDLLAVNCSKSYEFSNETELPHSVLPAELMTTALIGTICVFIISIIAVSIGMDHIKEIHQAECENTREILSRKCIIVIENAFEQHFSWKTPKRGKRTYVLEVTNAPQSVCRQQHKFTLTTNDRCKKIHLQTSLIVSIWVDGQFDTPYRLIVQGLESDEGRVAWLYMEDTGEAHRLLEVDTGGKHDDVIFENRLLSREGRLGVILSLFKSQFSKEHFLTSWMHFGKQWSHGNYHKSRACWLIVVFLVIFILSTVYYDCNVRPYNSFDDDLPHYIASIKLCEGCAENAIVICMISSALIVVCLLAFQRNWLKSVYLMYLRRMYLLVRKRIKDILPISDNRQITTASTYSANTVIELNDIPVTAIDDYKPIGFKKHITSHYIPQIALLLLLILLMVNCLYSYYIPKWNNTEEKIWQSIFILTLVITFLIIETLRTCIMIIVNSMKIDLTQSLPANRRKDNKKNYIHSKLHFWELLIYLALIACLWHVTSVNVDNESNRLNLFIREQIQNLPSGNQGIQAEYTPFELHWARSLYAILSDESIVNSVVASEVVLIQQRNKLDECQQPTVIANSMNITCQSYLTAEQDTASYNTGWRELDIESHTKGNSSSSGWSYSVWLGGKNDVILSHVNGMNRINNGYKTNLKLSNYQSAIDQMKHNKWIDERTESLTAQFSLLNTGLGYVSTIQITLRRLNTGGYKLSKAVSSYRFATWHSKTKASERLAMLYLLCLITVALVKSLAKLGDMSNRLKVIFGLEGVVSVLVIIMLIISSHRDQLINSLHACSVQATSTIYQQIGHHQMAIGHLLSWLNVISLLLLLDTILILKCFRPLTKATNITLSRMKAILIEASLIYFGFAIWGHLVFGRYERHFRSLGRSFISLADMMFQTQAYPTILHQSPILGPIYFVCYICFTLFLVLNIFTAIVQWSYTASRPIRKRKSHQAGKAKIVNQHSSTSNNCGLPSNEDHVQRMADEKRVLTSVWTDIKAKKKEMEYINYIENLMIRFTDKANDLINDHENEL